MLTAQEALQMLEAYAGTWLPGAGPRVRRHDALTLLRRHPDHPRSLDIRKRLGRIAPPSEPKPEPVKEEPVKKAAPKQVPAKEETKRPPKPKVPLGKKAK